MTAIEAMNVMRIVADLNEHHNAEKESLRAEVEEKHRLNMEYANEVLRLRADRLERAAIAAMQGLLSNLAAIRREGFRDEEIEEFALMRARALLAAVDAALAAAGRDE
jgi:hypothetical protein